MDALPPIPIPAARRWREFRIRRLPLVTFLTALGLVILIWKQHLTTPGILGEVETISADVISTVPGLIAELSVKPFDTVTKDQVIGKLLPVDPEALKASLAVIEMDVRVLRARMALDRAGNDLGYERLHLDYLNNRVQLARIKVDMQFAESDLTWAMKLREQGVGVDRDIELARTTRDARKEEVATLEKVVDEMEKRLQRLGSRNAAEEIGSVEKEIAAQEAALLMLEGPMALKAPMDGVISTVAFRAGQKVMGGLPIVTVTATRVEKIIGFVRQPLVIIPKIGDRVQVRTRSSPQKTAEARVLHVGADLQSVTNIMRLRGFERVEERGLPFAVNLPANLRLYPGELVDLVIRQ